MTREHEPDQSPSVSPPQRQYAERAHEGLRDVDAGDRAVRFQALAWGGAVAALVFAVSSLAAAVAGVRGIVLYLMWLGGLVAGAVVYRVATLLAFTGSAVFGRIHNPTGKSTPPKREYSRAKSLIAQGHFQDAIAAYEVAVADYPDDPEPYIGIARVYRDQLHDFEQAVLWFKRGRAVTDVAPGLELLVTQEIIEIFRNRMKLPKRSMPELARLLQRFPSHPSADALRAELAALRREYVQSEDAEI